LLEPFVGAFLMSSHDNDIPPETPKNLELSSEDRARLLFSTNRNCTRVYLAEFGAAASLFFVARLMTPYPAGRTWRFIAAKQAIVAVYNFSMAAKGMRTQARQIPELASAVSEIERIRESIKQEFPDLGDLRQTILHQGENFWNDERDRENRSRGPTSNQLGQFAGNVAISGCLAGNTYLATFSGRDVQFEITQTKVAALRDLWTRLDAIQPHAISSHRT
jgi:hypothetical protein